MVCSSSSFESSSRRIESEVVRGEEEKGLRR